MKANCFQMCEKTMVKDATNTKNALQSHRRLCNRIAFPSITSISTTPAFESHLGQSLLHFELKTSISDTTFLFEHHPLSPRSVGYTGNPIAQQTLMIALKFQ